MSWLKRAVPILLKAAAVLLFLIVLLCLLSRPWYYRLGYFGPRISGTVTVEMDGEVYALRAEDFSIQDQPLSGNRLTVGENADGSAAVSLRAGDHGRYAFTLKLDGLDRPLLINCYQYNWWNVTRFELLIRIDRASGMVYFESAAEDLGEDGHWRSEPNSKTADLSEAQLEYYIVSV